MSAPPYMKLFWGDYAKATRHLRHAREHGAYLLLIGALWDNGGRLPSDDQTLADYALVSVKEWEALKPKLLPFFRVRRGLLTQDRVTEELAKYESTSCKRKQAGKAGGKARGGKHSENGQAIANQKPTQSESESEGKESPLPPKGDGGLFGEVDEAAGDPADEVRTAFDLWNVTAKACGLPIAELLSDGRRKAIRKRLEIAGLDGWCRALAAVEVSPLCRGQKPGRDGGDPWRADLDFVCQAKSFARLIEGYYGAGAEPPKPVIPAGPPEDPWRKRLRMFVRDKSWNELDWGPRPGRPGCTVDPAILREFGIEPAKPQPVPEQAA